MPNSVNPLLLQVLAYYNRPRTPGTAQSLLDQQSHLLNQRVGRGG